MIVCIAEKPSVAKEIANVLGAKKKCDGYFEGNNYQVTWTFGHLCELKSPDDYKPEWKSWRFDTLPIIPDRFQIKLKDDKGVKKQFNIIKDLFLKADEIINCGDAGQEGELIQRWVLQKTNAKCPVKRLWINSLTEEDIKKGFQNLKDQSEYDSLYEAGLARAIGDWLLGMSGTRYYTMCNRKLGINGVSSIGRVQTPTLSLIVERQNEIDNFTPKDYWVLNTTYKNTVFQGMKGKYDTIESAEKDLSKVKDNDFIVTKVTTKNTKEGAPKLFDLTSLQVSANKSLGLSAEKTLSIIQSLYEKKFVTYPRVDTCYLPDTMYNNCREILEKVKPINNKVDVLLEKKLPKTKKVFDSKKVTDHHAIIPTGKIPTNLNDEEQHIYNAILKRFIAAFYPDCVSSSTTVVGKSNKIEFKTTGKQIIDIGWYAVYDKVPEGTIIPEFIKDESGAHDPSIVKKTTTPPKPYTEATLLRAMETAGKTVEDETMRDIMKENGIGRPSTRASIIETLFRREYITRNKKNIVPTDNGKLLINSIKEPLLKSAELTGQWEKKLRDIEQKKYDVKLFIDELKQMTYKIVGKSY